MNDTADKATAALGLVIVNVSTEFAPTCTEAGVNEALAVLEAQGTIRVEYGGLRILDLPALRSSVVAQVA